MIYLPISNPQRSKQILLDNKMVWTPSPNSRNGGIRNINTFFLAQFDNTHAQIANKRIMRYLKEDITWLAVQRNTKEEDRHKPSPKEK